MLKGIKITVRNVLEVTLIVLADEVRVTEGNMGDGEVESDNVSHEDKGQAAAISFIHYVYLQDDPGSLSSDSDFDDSVGGMGNKGRIKDHGDDFGTDGNF